MAAGMAGERPPETLARLRDYRCKKSEAESARSLHGDWREEPLFTLRHSLKTWHFHQTQRTEWDARIAEQMDSPDDQEKGPISPSPKQGAKAPDEPRPHELVEKFGVDLTAVEGGSHQTVLTFLGEVGQRG